MHLSKGGLMAFLAGAAAGAAATLLLAPASGKETRKRIQKASAEIPEQASKAVRDGKRKLEKKLR